MSAPRLLAMVLSDGDVDGTASSIAACRAAGVSGWVLEKQVDALAHHAALGVPVLATDWTADGAAVVDATAALSDWLLVLAAGEGVEVTVPGGAPAALAGVEPGPVRVPVGAGAEVRLHPPTPELTASLGGTDGPLIEGITIGAAQPVARRMHLGCGPNRLQGWINVDVEAQYSPDILHDLSKGLPAEDGSLDLVFSEHFWEHLHIDDGIELMLDCHRALRPGGVLRIAMPDLEECVRRYLGEWRGEAWIQNPVYDWIDTPARMINASFREWEHKYLYDAHDLTIRLQAAGFAAVRRCAWGQSEIPALRGLETRPESLLVVEAVR